ncbi:MAG: sensor domain-containing diguanylate cyclase [Deltaproteobacteria bacterium]|nr:sensor domain-containing diguanylate cyclase [Deltaproteobacteria bacterium]
MDEDEPEPEVDGVAARLAELEQENAALGRAISLLHQVARLVRESLELAPTCYALLTGVTAGVGLGLNRAMLFLVDDADRRFLRGEAAVGPMDGAEAHQIWEAIEAAAPDLQALNEAGLKQLGSPGPLDRWVRTTRVDVEGPSPVALALRRATTVRAEGTDDLGGLLHLPTAIATPVRGREVLRGVLYADNRFSGRPVDAVTELVFSLVADHGGRAIDAARQYEQVALRARTDALTGLGHHGALMEALGAAVAAARESGTALGLAMLDLDDFKRVNDTLGHLVGDALLAEVAGRLRAHARGGETPFRYGGEEFVILLREVGAAGLPAVGERLRRVLADRPFHPSSGTSRAITCSVGLAALGPGVADGSRLLDLADRAMLRAKAAGKNRVEVA